jgi:hypothetical protein
MSHIEEPRLLGELANIQHIFIKDGGLYIRVGNGVRSYLFGLFYDLLRWDIMVKNIFGRGLGDLPILTEFALEITPCRGDGE